jgi:hypothetical protein
MLVTAGSKYAARYKFSLARIERLAQLWMQSDGYWRGRENHWIRRSTIKSSPTELLTELFYPKVGFMLLQIELYVVLYNN